MAFLFSILSYPAAGCKSELLFIPTNLQPSFENRQERLSFLKQFSPEDLSVTLEREPDNRYDPNAIRIVVHIHSIRRRTVIGYVPKGLARELAKVIDMGIQVKASLMQIIGGYSYKESLGALVNIAV
ncbi:MAG: hypothetical protein HFI13_11355 [Lachnospiraceae bacterium]|nr:hypothetical protein [Lachnospiraceae bacterium]